MPESRLPLGNENDAAHCEKKKSHPTVGVFGGETSTKINVTKHFNQIRTGRYEAKNSVYTVIR